MRNWQPDFAVFSLPIAYKGHLTAKLSPALRAARVEIRCPSEAYVRAVNLCGGEPVAWSARLPSNPPPTRIASASISFIRFSGMENQFSRAVDEV